MQLEMGISTSRYLPAKGTAGLARSLVNGNSRVPCPPPMITESTLLVLIDCRTNCDISSPSFTRLREYVRCPQIAQGASSQRIPHLETGQNCRAFANKTCRSQADLSRSISA